MSEEGEALDEVVRVVGPPRPVRHLPATVHLPHADVIEVGAEGARDVAPVPRHGAFGTAVQIDEAGRAGRPPCQVAAGPLTPGVDLLLRLPGRRGPVLPGSCTGQ